MGKPNTLPYGRLEQRDLQQVDCRDGKHGEFNQALDSMSSYLALIGSSDFVGALTTQQRTTHIGARYVIL